MRIINSLLKQYKYITSIEGDIKNAITNLCSKSQEELNELYNMKIDQKVMMKSQIAFLLKKFFQIKQYNYAEKVYNDVKINKDKQVISKLKEDNNGIKSININPYQFINSSINKKNREL